MRRCLQEQLLSTRMLHFGSDQLYWQCIDKALLSEALPGEHSCKPIGLNPMLDPTPGMLPGVPGSRWTLAQDRWPNILENYQERTLTQAGKDKLRAIQGVADRITQARSTEYVCGFFWKDLPLALLWKVRGDCTASRAEPYREPTWSWSSMDGPLTMYRDFGRGSRGTKYKPLMACAKSLDLHRDHGTEKALLCIGRVVRIPPHTTFTKKHIVATGWALHFTMYGLSFRFEVDDARELEHTSRTGLFVLPLAYIYPGNAPPYGAGLLLSCNEDGTFARLGVVRYPQEVLDMRFEPSRYLLGISDIEQTPFDDVFRSRAAKPLLLV